MAAEFEIVITESFSGQGAAGWQPTPSQPLPPGRVGEESAPPMPLPEPPVEPYGLREIRDRWEEWQRDIPAPPEIHGPYPPDPASPVGAMAPPERPNFDFMEDVAGPPAPPVETVGPPAPTYGVHDVQPTGEIYGFEGQREQGGEGAREELERLRSVMQNEKRAYTVGEQRRMAELEQQIGGTYDLARDDVPAPEKVETPPEGVAETIGIEGERLPVAAPAPRRTPREIAAEIGGPEAPVDDIMPGVRDYAGEAVPLDLEEGREKLPTAERLGTFDFDPEALESQRESVRVMDEARRRMEEFSEAVERAKAAAEEEARVREEIWKSAPDTFEDMYGKKAAKEMEEKDDEPRRQREEFQEYSRSWDDEDSATKLDKVGEFTAGQGGQGGGLGGIQGILSQMGMKGAGGIVGQISQLMGGMGGGAGAAAGAGAAGAGAGGAAAGGAGAMAGMGGMMAAAGPIGAAVALAEVASRKMAGTVDGVRESLEGFGKQAQMLARNEHMAMFTTATEGAAKALEEIPIAGKVWAAELRLATAPVRVFGDTVNAFVDRAREISQYNGQLAGATAMADVRRLMADIKEANEVGPEMARLVDSQARFEVALRDLLLPIKEVIVGVLANALEKIAGTMEGISAKSEAMVAVMTGILEVINLVKNFNPKAAAEKTQQVLDDIRKLTTRIAEKDDIKDADALFGNLLALGGGPDSAPVRTGWDGRARNAPPLVGGF